LERLNEKCEKIFICSTNQPYYFIRIFVRSYHSRVYGWTYSLQGFGYMITKQNLENAARAMGHRTFQWSGLPEVLFVTAKSGAVFSWQPLATTTQGKTNLMDLMLALSIQYNFLDNCDGTPPFAIIAWCKDSNGDDVESYYTDIINNNKHAALAEAVISVASQIWEQNHE
jgi:hypothetical protein